MPNTTPHHLPEAMALIQPDAPPHHYLIDATGLLCPEPLMMLHQHLRKAQSGEALLLIATDPSTQRDIKKLSTHLGHPLLHEQHQAPYQYFWIQKK